MKNYWKQFVEWATELRHDLFLQTRAKLMISYIVTITILFLIFFFGLRYLIDFLELENEGVIYAFSIGIAVTSMLVSYFLSGIALGPIKKAMYTQKRFIADASHELRTPLSIMKTNSEVTLLEGQDLNTSDATNAIKSNLEEIDRMSNILQNLLNLSEIDSKNVEIPFTRVNLADVVLHCLHSVDRMASVKRVRLEVSKSDSAMIWGNITALEELVLNLLKNAVFYTPEDGQVSVSINYSSPEKVELIIRDTGIGIPSKDLPHIFEPFYKADISRLRKAGGGSGLGLTIVREIVKKHQGSISVKSAVGKGTAVIVNFPSNKGLSTTRA